jgi:hypothetical protein
LLCYRRYKLDIIVPVLPCTRTCFGRTQWRGPGSHASVALRSTVTIYISTCILQDCKSPPAVCAKPLKALDGGKACCGCVNGAAAGKCPHACSKLGQEHPECGGILTCPGVCSHGNGNSSVSLSTESHSLTVRKTAFLCGSDSPSVCPEPVSANQLLHDVTRQTKGCFPQGGPRQVAHARRRLEAGRAGLGDADPSWMSYATNPNGPWCALPSSYTSTSITGIAANSPSRLPVSRNCIGLHVVR